MLLPPLEPENLALREPGAAAAVGAGEAASGVKAKEGEIPRGAGRRCRCCRRCWCRCRRWCRRWTDRREDAAESARLEDGTCEGNGGGGARAGRGDGRGRWGPAQLLGLAVLFFFALAEGTGEDCARLAAVAAGERSVGGGRGESLPKRRGTTEGRMCFEV